MNSIAITGCSRGLGLGIVKQLVAHENPPAIVIASCRKPEQAEELRSIADNNKNVHILPLDVTDFDSFPEFAKRVSGIVKDNGLNVLLNNAGVSPKYTRIHYVKANQLMDTFATNTVGPVMLTKALLPMLKIAANKNSSQPLGSHRAAIVNMSSVLGSMQLCTDGGLYPYRCSKAALNMAAVSMSIDLKKDAIMAMTVHPGWVKTDLGGANAPMDIESSTSSIVRLLYNLNDSHNGGFFDFSGKSMPW